MRRGRSPPVSYTHLDVYKRQGYDYGGLEPLVHYSQGKGLSAFNFEQQADIIEDYYRWTAGMPLQWALNVPGIGVVLEKYRDELA